jgi:hypothetical protein
LNINSQQPNSRIKKIIRKGQKNAQGVFPYTYFILPERFQVKSKIQKLARKVIRCFSDEKHPPNMK